MNTLANEGQNLVQIFLDRARRYSSKIALGFKQNGIYRFLTWTEWQEKIRFCTLGLYSLGIQSGSRIAILSENRPEWTIADFAGLSLGAVIVPIYPTLTAKEILYILKNSDAEVVFASDPGQLGKVRGIAPEVPSLKHIYQFDAPAKGDKEALSFASLLGLGKGVSLNDADLYERLVNQVSPQQTATIIYTSGTTGPPKGVMLSHSNFVQNYLGAREFIHVTGNDVALSFLPLSHVFERLAGYYFMAFSGARIVYAENMQTVPQNMLEVRPTVAAAVPRFYEKAYSRVMEKVAAAPRSVQRLFAWGLAVSKEYAAKSRVGQPTGIGLRCRYFLAKILVLKAIRKGFGGRMRFFISGGAPLSKELAEFFFNAGVLILEGYGLTETSPVITVNTVRDFKFGTVGKVLPNVRIKIADNGEILTAGPCVMQGYYKNPGATAEVTRGDWFATGDVGEIDREGFLKITDRIKDIIVTSGGKNVSPQNIEKLLQEDKLFSQTVVLGDKRNYLVALIVPNRTEIECIAEALGLSNLPWEELLEHPRIYHQVEGRLRVRTKDLANYEQIKCFKLLGREFSMESGELTPTLKIKRKLVMERHQKIIDTLYQNPSNAQGR